MELHPPQLLWDYVKNWIESKNLFAAPDQEFQNFAK